MNELKFNSQICTTKEQSKRLLELGLKPETADMSLTVVCGAEIAQWVGELKNLGNIKVNDIGVPNEEVENVPAWSLHRLFEIYSTSDDDCYVVCIDRAFDDIIDDIKWSVNKGYFNKEYLKQ